MRPRTPTPRRNRISAGVHLRLARLADLPGVVVFCERQRGAELKRDNTAAELSALLRGQVDTVIVALRDGTLLGVALCGVTRKRARLIKLAVEPGREQASIERRLLRRSLRNLRALGLRSLDFSGTNAAVAGTSAPPIPDDPIRRPAAP